MVNPQFVPNNFNNPNQQDLNNLNNYFLESKQTFQPDNDNQI